MLFLHFLFLPRSSEVWNNSGTAGRIGIHKKINIYKTGYYEYDSKMVIVPIATGQKMVGYDNAVTGVAVKVRNFSDSFPTMFVLIIRLSCLKLELRDCIFSTRFVLLVEYFLIFPCF